MRRLYLIACELFIPFLVVLCIVGSAKRIPTERVSFNGKNAEEVSAQANEWIRRQKPHVVSMDTTCPDGDIVVTVTYRGHRR